MHSQLSLLLPLLFAGAMALIDTADGMMMQWAYKFGLKDDGSRLLFNLYLTLVSATIALSVATVEVLGCLQAGRACSKFSWLANCRHLHVSSRVPPTRMCLLPSLPRILSLALCASGTTSCHAIPGLRVVDSSFPSAHGTQ